MSECVPDRIRNDALGGMIHNAAEVSALAVLRLRVPVSEAAVTAALDRCPTLLDALISLHRRNDIRPIIRTERKDHREHRTHLAGEPIAFALTWVHSRCNWPSRRNGAELWDYVGQSARGDIVDAEVREAVVPELRAVDTAETRRAFWTELLSRFPNIGVELAQVEQKPKTTETVWRDVQRRLLELYERGDAYTSIGDLAKRLACAKATIQKAIKDSTKLKGWQARHAKAKGSPRASSSVQSCEP